MLLKQSLIIDSNNSNNSHMNKFTKEKMLEKFFLFFINTEIESEIIKEKIYLLDKFFIPTQLLTIFFEIKERLMLPMESFEYDELVLKRMHLFDFLKKKVSKNQLICNISE